MVSKSTLYRQPSIVFVSIGSTHFHFSRVYKSLSSCENSEFMIAKQSYKNNLSDEALIYAIKGAQRVIIHAAPSTLYIVSQYAKYMPLIVPRRARLGEAVGDHQLYYAEYVRNKLPKKYQKYVLLDIDIAVQIADYLARKNEANILSRYLFPKEERELFKRSFNDLLINQGLIES